jgi:hypothetical protein
MIEPESVRGTESGCAFRAPAPTRDRTSRKFPTDNIRGSPARTLPTMPVDGEVTIVARRAQLWAKTRSARRLRSLPYADYRVHRRSREIRRRALPFIRDRGTPDRSGPRTDRDVGDPAPERASIYRLSADRNPCTATRTTRHVRVCTYGLPDRTILHALAGGDPACVRSADARFAEPVFPGDVLHTDLWHTPGGAMVQASAGGFTAKTLSWTRSCNAVLNEHLLSHYSGGE